MDPFGQSAVMAQVLKRMGYDAMYINRVQYAIKRVLAEQHNMDFIWRQHWDSVGSTDMMVHMHPFFNYDVPHSCGPQPGVCCQFDFLRLGSDGPGVGAQSDTIFRKTDSGTRIDTRI